MDEAEGGHVSRTSAGVMRPCLPLRVVVAGTMARAERTPASYRLASLDVASGVATDLAPLPGSFA